VSASQRPESLLGIAARDLERLVLTDVESGNLQVHAVSPGLEWLTDRLQQLGSRLSLTAFAAALSICAAILAPAALARDLRSGLFLLSITLAVSGWTVLLWWTGLGRGRPLRLTPLLKLFRRN
jgi:hypothetical protein